jgi:SAM-dependent methyltransferase
MTSLADQQTQDFDVRHVGFCPACETETVFIARDPYFRSSLRCGSCDSAPRHRALMAAIQKYFPTWRSMAIHECSPGWDVISRRLAAENSKYIATQYDLSVPFGQTTETPMPCKTYRSENLESQTFEDGIFDLVVTQDVFEHVFRPDLAVKEIARTLRAGGAMIMTVPLVMGPQKSRRRATMVNNAVKHLIEPPQFHGSPIGDEGSLVTIDWGYDIAPYLQNHSGIPFLLLSVENKDQGILGTLNEVLIGFKTPFASV